MDNGNSGRSYHPDIDLTQALANHYNSELVVEKLRECHKWLNKDAHVTPEQKKLNRWSVAYDLSPWECYPCEITGISKVLLHRIGFHRTGPTAESEARSKTFLNYFIDFK